MRLFLRFIKKLIINIFKFINFIRLFILNSLFIIILLMIFVSVDLFDDESQQQIQVEQNSYLTINLNGFIVEQKQAVNISKEISKQLSGSNQEVPEEFETQTVINTINYAQQDKNITGLILELTGLQSASLDQLTDIGEAITQFKTSGKPVFAYSDNYSQIQYYLATYADKITLPPNGTVMLQGYAVNRLYFKELIDTLLITPHIFKVGTYKSFVEPYTQTEMSSYSKQANKHWLDQLWQGYIDHVLTQRKDNKLLTPQSINPSLAYLKKQLTAVSGDTSEYARSAGLVDDLQFYEDFLLEISNSAKTENQAPHLISYQSYNTVVPKLYQSTGLPNQIAVIHGSGEIVSGYSDGLAIADKSFNVLLNKARSNKNIKAVVIRLDTPGGSAFASENIRQQVLKLKKSGKQVVVSMGSVTASGGYWIASAADKIVAAPTTLTGSIGIFGMFATIDKTLNKIGIHQDGVSTNPLANLGITQPLTPELAEIFQIGIENGYAQFLKVVSEGRNMSTAAVDKVAQGRVWTGVDGLNNGLVDELGNLQDAIKLAAKLADLKEFDIVSVKPKETVKQAFFNKMLEQSITLLPVGVIKQPALLSLFNQVEQQANFVTRLNDPQSRFVYCTVCKIQ